MGSSAISGTGDVNRHIDHQLAQSPNDQIQRTRIRSDRVRMNVLSVLKSRTRTAGLCGVIIVDSRSTGVEMSTNGNAGSIIDSTGFPLMPASCTSASYR